MGTQSRFTYATISIFLGILVIAYLVRTIEQKEYIFRSIDSSPEMTELLPLEAAVQRVIVQSKRYNNENISWTHFVGRRNGEEDREVFMGSCLIHQCKDPMMMGRNKTLLTNPEKITLFYGNINDFDLVTTVLRNMGQQMPDRFFWITPNRVVLNKEEIKERLSRMKNI